MTGTKLSLAAGVILFLSAHASCACPRIGGLIDFNCDGKHKIAVTGDSIVFGRGDELRDDRGGYVPRLKRLFPKSKFIKLGYPGITSARLLGFYKKVFSKKTHPVQDLLVDIDLLLIDVGRNDYFNQNPSELTVTTVKRLGKYLAAEIKQKSGFAPLLVESFLLPTTREFQAPFIQEVNDSFFKLRSEAFPVYLRFDLIDPLTISDDGIHPSSIGYDAMTALAAEYIVDDAQMRAAEMRPDRDNDGVYDIFEVRKFGTDPSLADTDGDGFEDGREIFKMKTDPLAADAPPSEQPERVAGRESP